MTTAMFDVKLRQGHAIRAELVAAIREQYTQHWFGLHGVHHWLRVLQGGLVVSEGADARMAVVELFAFFHDSRRMNEGADPDHGPRGAMLAEKLRGKYFELSDDDFDLLQTACRLHTRERTHDDPTVQVCMDADRLDLPRIGKTIMPFYMNTARGKDPQVIAWATERSQHLEIPDLIPGSWYE